MANRTRPRARGLNSRLRTGSLACPPLRFDPVRRLALRVLAALLSFALFAGCAQLDEQQRRWIFQPAAGSLGRTSTTPTACRTSGSTSTRQPPAARARLHGLWLPQEDAAPARRARAALPARRALGRDGQRQPHAPHARARLLGARRSTTAASARAAPSCRRKRTAYEDARAAWRLAGRAAPGRGRATSSAIRSAARSRSTWRPRSTTRPG